MLPRQLRPNSGLNPRAALRVFSASYCSAVPPQRLELKRYLAEADDANEVAIWRDVRTLRSTIVRWSSAVLVNVVSIAL